MAPTSAIRKAPLAKKSIRVDLTRQIVEAFEGTTLIYRFECVSGDASHPTDRGIFRVFDKQKSYTSHTYRVPMNFALFFTHDRKAIHQYHGPVPLSLIRNARSSISEWFGSHGCVRLVEADAKTLFEWTPSGTKVQVI